MRIATISLVLAIFLPHVPVAAQVQGFAAALPPLNSQVASLVINTPSGKRVGTAFCVSKEGYVATSFNNVRNATSATVVSNGALSGLVTLEVTGAVAVNKSRDLVILATSLKQVVPNLTFDPKADLALQTILQPQPGPLSKPLLELMPYTLSRIPYLPHLQGKASGEDFLSGLKNDGIIGLGTDPALEWMILDVPVEETYAGAPVWNETYTSIVGIVSSATDGTPGVRYVLPIKYVLDLVPQKPPTLIHLAKLAKWEDPKQLPPAPGAAQLAGTNGASRWASSAESRSKLETASATLQQLKGKFAAGAQAAVQSIQAADARLKGMKGELSHKEEKLVKKEKRDSKGKVIEKEEYKDVTVYDYSPRQLAERSGIVQSINASQTTILVTTLHSEMIDKNLLPHTQRRTSEATVELFLAADPLELRSLAELEPLQKKLDERIQQGTDPLDYLMRAVILTRKREGVAARNDLAAMVQLDAKFTPLKLVLERRLENFENKTQLAAPPQTMKSPLLELLVPLVAARIEWDNGDGKNAVKILTRWLPAHQRHADVHTALAWEMLDTKPAAAVTNKQALQYAWDAVELSRGRDWLALGSLTAAQVRNKDIPGAQVTLTYLTPLMPAEKQELLASWQKAVAEKEEPVRAP